MKLDQPSRTRQRAEPDLDREEVEQGDGQLNEVADVAEDEGRRVAPLVSPAPNWTTRSAPWWRSAEVEAADTAPQRAAL